MSEIINDNTEVRYLIEYESKQFTEGDKYLKNGTYRKVHGIMISNLHKLVGTFSWQRTTTRITESSNDPQM